MGFDRDAWVKENKDRLRAYHAEWRKRNRQRLRDIANSAETKAKRKVIEARPERKAKIIARVIKWQKDNRDRVNAKNVKWKRNNPEARSKQSAERRARELNAPGSHTVTETKKLLADQNFLCANPFCRADLRAVKRHLDHKIALCRGGSNSIENLQWLCKPCNLSKWAKDYDAWLAEQGESS